MIHDTESLKLKKRVIKKSIYTILTLIGMLLATVIIYSNIVRRIKLSDSVPEIDRTRDAKIVSAFFGLDNALPLQSLLLYYKAYGKDGMPVVFSQEIDPSSLDNSDFEVVTKSGKTKEVEFVTLKPANEEFELRTVLLIGEVGNHPEDPPVLVTIKGDLLSRSGQNFKGQKVLVTPLPDGPSIKYAEFFIIDDNYPYVKSGMGCDCPKETTKMVVRTVWSGGVRATNGQQLGANELGDFEVTLISGQDTLQVQPFQLADLRDGDNNIDLCLDVVGIPTLVKANAGIAIDPRGDINPKTTSTIHSRW